MAFPYVFQSNFEIAATPFGFDSETDTGTQLDLPHYSVLANLPWPTAAPYNGAYCLRAVLSGGTADAFVTEGDCNIALATNNFFAFNIWFSPDFTGTADDTFNLFEAQSTASVAEVTVSGRIVAATNVINLGIGKVAATSWSAYEIERGKWYTVEVDTTPATAGVGTIDLYLTKEEQVSAALIAATQVGSLTNLEVTHAVIGIQDHLATTTGTILFDRFFQDDARIYAQQDRFNPVKTLTQSGHAFVGPGTVCNVTLLSGAGTDCVLQVFDTDIGNSNDHDNCRLELKNTANNETVDPAGVPFDVIRGCYVVLTGTNPRAKIKYHSAVMGSVGTIRGYGLKRN